MSISRRGEYPRPNLVREEWMSLNGMWTFAFDDDNRGGREKWYEDPTSFDREIHVPFAYQTSASGINLQEHHPVLWYAKSTLVPKDWKGQDVYLHFGAVDYEATVWVNGHLAGHNQGGYVPFRLNVTPYIDFDDDNTIVVRVEDQARFDQPRGKQSARDEPWACWYTPVSGIWQTVWMEALHPLHLKDIHLIPDIDKETLTVGYTLNRVDDGLSLEVIAEYEGQVVSSAVTPIAKSYVRWSNIEPVDRGEVVFSIPRPHLWSPEHPHLYDLTVRLRHRDKVVDEVKTYFGMRKVHVENGQFYLNNRRYYQRLVLDQGYWPEGLYTAPSADAIRKDVELIKSLGFNGARKHQKIEDPYFYYFCDKLGLLVWSEMPAAYEYTEIAAQRVMAEWQRAVLRDRNHPSIVAWVPVNESWGVDQLRARRLPQAEAHLLALYYATHALDGTRPVVSNDGWQHAQTDLIAIHDYTQHPEDLEKRLNAFRENPSATTFSHGLPTLLPGYVHSDQPVLVTEFGGVKVEAQQVEGWGYGQAAADYDEMVERIRGLVDVILAAPGIEGYCYTQLTDVQQEVNGLLTMEREPKVNPKLLRQVFTGHK